MNPINVLEIEKIIKKSELWRMSNYIGRDTGEYSGRFGLNGTQALACAITEYVNSKLIAYEEDIKNANSK